MLAVGTSTAAEGSIQNFPKLQRMVHDHICTPVAWVVFRVDIAIAHRGGSTAGRATGLDIAKIVADEQNRRRIEVELFASK
jgi:hypothetical protein